MQRGLRGGIAIYEATALAGPAIDAEFMGYGCEHGLTPGDFFKRCKYFPMEAAKLVVRTDSPESFAKGFNSLVDTAMLGAATINDMNTRWNEYDSDKDLCASGERRPLSIAKDAYIGMKNEYNNAAFSCFPEVSKEGLFGKIDYEGLRKALGTTMDKSLIKSFDGDDVNLSGFRSDLDLKAYLASAFSTSSIVNQEDD